MKRLLLLAVLFASCAKDNIQPAEPKTVQPTIYNYSMDVLILKDPNNKTYGDTLTIRVNGKTIYNKIGSTPEYIADIKVKTGDNLYLYYNPGLVDAGTYGVIAQYNVLECKFTGGQRNPYIKFNTRGPAKYEGVLKEY